MPNDNLKKLHSNLTNKWEGFNVSYDQFKTDMQNESNLKKLHSNLTKEWEGFSVPYEQFKSDMGVGVKKKVSGEPSVESAEQPGEPSTTQFEQSFPQEQVEFDPSGIEVPGVYDDPVEAEIAKQWDNLKLKAGTEEEKNYLEQSKQASIEGRREQKAKVEAQKNAKKHSELYNKDIDAQVESINLDRESEGQPGISREDFIRDREESYSSFLMEEDDLESFQNLRQMQMLEQSIENAEQNLMKLPQYQKMTQEARDKVLKAQIEKDKSLYSESQSKIQEHEKNRVQKIDNRIDELSRRLANEDDPEQKDIISKRIRLLSSQKENFFKDITQNTKGLVEKSGSKKITSTAPMTKDDFNKYYDGLYQEYNELMNSKPVKAMLGEEGAFQEAVSRGTYAVYQNPKLKRFEELKEVLEEYAPIRLLNRYTTGQTESLGFIEEGAGRFGKEFWSKYSGAFRAHTPKSQLEKSQQLAGDLMQLGTPLNENVKVSADIREDGTFGDHGLDDPEFWGSTLGTSAGIMHQMMASEAIPVNMGGVKLVNRTKALRNISKAKGLSKLLRKAGYGAAKLTESAIKEGVKYQKAGLTFQKNQDELNFVSGLYGGIGSGIAKGLLQKSKPLQRSIMNMFSKEGQSKMVQAISNFGGKVSKQVASRTGAGIGEVAEEFSQEIANIHMSDNPDFFAEMEKRFGTMDKASKLVVSSFVMGFFMGGGSNSVTEGSQKRFTDDYKKLKETNPEQAAIVDNVVNSITDEYSNVVKESIDPEKQKVSESGEPGYFINDKQVSKDEVIKSIEDSETMDELSQINIFNDEEVNDAYATKVEGIVESTSEPIEIDESEKQEAFKQHQLALEDYNKKKDFALDKEVELESLPEDAPIEERQRIESELEEAVKARDEAGEVYEKAGETYGKLIDQTEKIEKDAIQERETETMDVGEQTEVSPGVVTEGEKVIEGETTEVKKEEKIREGEQLPEEKVTERLQLKGEYTSKSGRQVAKFNEETGKLEITNKNGTTPDPKTARKVRREYEADLDYHAGERLNPQTSDPDQHDKAVASQSNNPGEIVEAYSNRVDRQQATETDFDQGLKENFIAERLGKISPESLSRFGDENKITDQIKGNYLAKEGEMSEDIDAIAEEMSEAAGIEITPEDIVDFIYNNPKGVNQFFKKPPKDQVLSDLEARFTELTGLKINPNVMDQVMKQSEITEKRKTRLQDETERYTEDQFQEWLESTQGGKVETKADAVVEETTPTEEVHRGERVTAEKPAEKGPIIEPKETGVERTKSIFANAISRTKLSKEVKDKLSKNLKYNALTEEETQRVAKQYIKEFDGTPREAFDSLQGVSSDIMRTAVGVEAVNKLKKDYEKNKDNPSNQEALSAQQADIINIIEELQFESRDRGRAINYIKKLYEFASPEAYNIAVQNSIEKANQKTAEKHNVSPVEDSDLSDINKDVMSEPSVSKLMDEIESLKKQVEDLKKKGKGKDRKKKAKENRDLLFKAWKIDRNRPKDIGEMSILGLSDRDVMYAARILKTYVEEGVGSVEEALAKIKSEIENNLNIKVSDEELAKIKDEYESKELDKIRISKDIIERYLLNGNRAELEAAIIEETDVDYNQAKKLADKIEKRVTSKLKEKLANMLNKKLQGSTVKNKKKAAKNIAEKTVLLHRTGADMTHAARVSYGEQFGILDMSNEKFQKDLSGHIDKILSAPEGSRIREKAESKMMEWLTNHRKMSYYNLMRSYYFSNILSGYNTHLNNISYGANVVLKEMVKNAVVGVFKPEFRQANKDLFKAFDVSWSIARDVYKSGVEGDVKFETPSAKTSKMERTNELKRSKFRFMNAVMRALMAEDEYFTTLVKESKLSKLLYEEAVSKEMEKSPNGKVSSARRKEILKSLNAKRYDVKTLRDNSLKANEEVTTYWKLEHPAMIETKSGFKFNPKNKVNRSLKKEIERDFNIRQYELNESYIDPVGEVTENAYEYAKQEILSGKPTGTAGILYSWVQNSIGTVPLAQLISIPFVKVPLNSAKRIIDYTPILGTVWHSAKLIGKWSSSQKKTSESTLGLLVPDEYLKRMGIESNLTETRRRKVVQSQIVGAVVTASLYGLIKAFEDDEEEINPIFDITGDLGADYKRQEILTEAEKKRPYTIYIGGEPIMSYLYSPYVGIFALVGSVRDKERGDSKEKYNSIYSKWIMSSVENANVVVDQSAMTGINRMMTTTNRVFERAIKGEGEETSDLIIKEMTKSFQNLIPASGALKQVNDDVKAIWGMPKTEITNSLEYFYRGIPIADNYMEEKTDYLGYPIKRKLDLSITRFMGKTNELYKLFEEFNYDITKKVDYNPSGWIDPDTGEQINFSMKEKYKIRELVKQYRDENINIDHLYNMQTEAQFAKYMDSLNRDAYAYAKREYFLERE
jgi:hypothetical protein